MALAVFALIGLIRDGSKMFSILSIIIGGFLFFLIAKESVDEVSDYSVEYRVDCRECDISYTNSTGGTDKAGGYVGWSRRITAKGGDFLYINAQNGSEGGSVKASIYVNNILVKSETSSGEFSIASASCRPVDVNTK
ncbi:hypothetical protein DR864_00465 [Runella rosea]|uniref:Uncharacterized protein n=2 Tax=Runella rosea TaxID=2259595 RepID=A0A344TCD5_9BACT|nr:hypothetical protein DR864_00190 [Runella rosea]AXE16306.1 hypothetical protein DR864_00465 [Runella rosea]